MKFIYIEMHRSYLYNLKWGIRIMPPKFSHVLSWLIPPHPEAAAVLVMLLTPGGVVPVLELHINGDIHQPYLAPHSVCSIHPCGHIAHTPSFLRLTHV